MKRAGVHLTVLRFFFFFLVSRTRHHSCAGHCSTKRSLCNFIQNATIPPGRNTQQKNTKPTATKQKTNNATPFFFFFLQPCRSSRSKLRGEFGIPRHSQNRKQKHTKATKPNNNTKQTKDKSRQVLECETRGEKRVKRPKRPNALICRTPGGSMRYP